MSYDGGGIQSITAGSGIAISAPTQNPTISATIPIVYQGTYYKSTLQTLTSPATDITFDETASWNNTNDYITHTNGSKDFTVTQAGLYQLEWNAIIVANGATWGSATSKQISIDITRTFDPPVAEVVVIPQNAFIPSNTNYGQSLCCTFKLQVGDVINCRVVNTFTSGSPYVNPVQNNFGFNTWFSWRFIYDY